MGRSSDFKFWEERLSVGHRCCEDELFEFQMRGEDQVEASSPPLWRRPETSTLLPENHQYSCLSPTSRLRAIVDGKRELMEMLKDIPESSYELTLKDIVEHQDKEDVVTDEEKVKHKTPLITKSANTKQICRSESMESEVFLLKMFLPVSLGSKRKKKKAKTRKHSREGPARRNTNQEDREAACSGKIRRVAKVDHAKVDSSTARSLYMKCCKSRCSYLKCQQA